MGVDPTVLAALLYLTALFCSERVLTPELRQLTAEEKVRLVDASSEIRYTRYIPSALAIAILSSAITVWPQHTGRIVVSVYAAFLVATVTVSIYIWRRMRTLDIRESYLRRWALSQAIYTVGVACLCAYVAQYYLEMPQ